MPMADFNKDSRLVIMMRKKEEHLSKIVLSTTKRLILILATTLVIAIPPLFINSFTLLSLIPLIITILIAVYGIRKWIRLISESELAAVNNIIYGDKFSKIYVNEEDIFRLLCRMNFADGQLSSFENEPYFYVFVVSTLSAIVIIIKLFM